MLDVDKCISEAKWIRETIEDLAQMEIDGLVALDNYTDDSLSEHESSVDDCQTRAIITPDEQCSMEALLRECNFNWLISLKKRGTCLMHFMMTYLQLILLSRK